MFSHREIYGDIYSEPCSYRRVGVKRLKCDLKKILGVSMVMAIFEWEKLSVTIDATLCRYKVHV